MQQRCSASSALSSSKKIRGVACYALVALLAATLLLPFNLNFAYATPTAEKQAEADEANAALAVAEVEMQQITDNYLAAAAAHEESVAAMNDAQARIDTAEAIITETQQKLGNRANQMYRQGSLSFLDVLFGASSFEEFTTSWDLINAINQENATLIQANKDARIEAEAAHEEYSLQETTAAQQLAQTEAIMLKATALLAEQQALVDGLDAEVAALLDAEQAARAGVTTAAAQQGNSSLGSYVPSGGYGSVVAAAQSRLGTPYVYGGTGPDMFDCSGFTSWCYSQAGLGSIGRDTYAQRANATDSWYYSEGGASPGDVLWWPTITHVAIYIGGGQYIHAPLPDQSVCVSSYGIENLIVLRF